MPAIVNCSLCNDPLELDISLDNIFFDEQTDEYWHLDCYEEYFGEKPPLSSPAQKK